MMNMQIEKPIVERHVGRRVETKENIRLGTLGRLDRMNWSEFRWLPLSEQKELINEGRNEAKKIGEIKANDATVLEALGKRRISVESSIIKKRENKCRNGDGIAFNRHEKVYKQISVALEIPGMNNGESLTICGKRHAYKSIHLIAKNSYEISGSYKERFGNDRDGHPYYITHDTKWFYHRYHDEDRKITHPEYDFNEIKLTGIAINGTLLSGSVQKNPIRDFFAKLFRGSRHTIEIGCCAITEKGGKLHLHYEKLQALVPKNAPIILRQDTASKHSD